MPAAQATRRVADGGLDATRQWVDDTLSTWGVRTPVATSWLPHARGLADGRLALEYDRRAGLVSVDLWQGEQRVFGIDDWVG